MLLIAKSLSTAARIHRWADLELANEIMVRHGQWILKYGWHRVKMEAASGAERRALRRAEADLHRDYDSFLQADSTLDRLELIGAGLNEIEVTLARSEMDVE